MAVAPLNNKSANSSEFNMLVEWGIITRITCTLEPLKLPLNCKKYYANQNFTTAVFPTRYLWMYEICIALDTALFIIAPCDIPLLPFNTSSTHVSTSSHPTKPLLSSRVPFPRYYIPNAECHLPHSVALNAIYEIGIDSCCGPWWVRCEIQVLFCGGGVVEGGVGDHKW